MRLSACVSLDTTAPGVPSDWLAPWIAAMTMVFGGASASRALVGATRDTQVRIARAYLSVRTTARAVACASVAAATVSLDTEAVTARSRSLNARRIAPVTAHVGVVFASARLDGKDRPVKSRNCVHVHARATASVSAAPAPARRASVALNARWSSNARSSAITTGFVCMACASAICIGRASTALSRDDARRIAVDEACVSTAAAFASLGMVEWNARKLVVAKGCSTALDTACVFMASVSASRATTARTAATR